MNKKDGWHEKPPDSSVSNTSAAGSTPSLIGEKAKIVPPSSLLNNKDIEKIYMEVENSYAINPLQCEDEATVQISVADTTPNNGTTNPSACLTNTTPTASEKKVMPRNNNNELQRLLENDVSLYTQLKRRKRLSPLDRDGAKKRSNQQPALDSSINNENRFGIFNQLEEENVTADSSKTVNNVEIKNKNQRAFDWCPPIFIKGVQSSTLLKFMKDNYPDKMDLVRFQNRGFGRIKLLVGDLDLHNLFMTNFKAAQADAFSFKPKALKKEAILLKGLSGGISCKEVGEDILKVDPSIDIEEVKEFTTGWSKKNNISLDTYTCIVNNRESLSKLRNIKFLLHHKIRWERFERKGPLQCFRCQRFGHSSQYCAYKARCVKCAEIHDEGQCKVTADMGRENTSCVNCGESGHPASFSGCPKRSSYFKDRISGNQKDPKQSLITSRISFADITRGGKPKQSETTNTNNNDFAAFLKESIILFGIPITELLTRVKNFWPEYNKLNKEDKPLAYLGFIASLSP